MSITTRQIVEFILADDQSGLADLVRENAVDVDEVLDRAIKLRALPAVMTILNSRDSLNTPHVMIPITTAKDEEYHDEEPQHYDHAAIAKQCGYRPIATLLSLVDSNAALESGTSSDDIMALSYQCILQDRSRLLSRLLIQANRNNLLPSDQQMQNLAEVAVVLGSDQIVETFLTICKISRSHHSATHKISLNLEKLFNMVVNLDKEAIARQLLSMMKRQERFSFSQKCFALGIVTKLHKKLFTELLEEVDPAEIERSEGKQEEGSNQFDVSLTMPQAMLVNLQLGRLPKEAFGSAENRLKLLYLCFNENNYLALHALSIKCPELFLDYLCHLQATVKENTAITAFFRYRPEANQFLREQTAENHPRIRFFCSVLSGIDNVEQQILIHQDTKALRGYLQGIENMPENTQYKTLGGLCYQAFDEDQRAQFVRRINEVGRLRAEKPLAILKSMSLHSLIPVLHQVNAQSHTSDHQSEFEAKVADAIERIFEYLSDNPADLINFAQTNCWVHKRYLQWRQYITPQQVDTIIRFCIDTVDRGRKPIPWVKILTLSAVCSFAQLFWLGFVGHKVSLTYEKDDKAFEAADNHFVEACEVPETDHYPGAFSDYCDEYDGVISNPYVSLNQTCIELCMQAARLHIQMNSDDGKYLGLSVGATCFIMSGAIASCVVAYMRKCGVKKKRLPIHFKHLTPKQRESTRTVLRTFRPELNDTIRDDSSLETIIVALMQVYQQMDKPQREGAQSSSAVSRYAITAEAAKSDAMSDAKSDAGSDESWPGEALAEDAVLLQPMRRR